MKKVFALVLSLLMVITVIPVGVISVSAVNEGVKTVDLTAYDTTDTFTINSIADWKAISESGKDFAGKTVVLGANIGGASASDMATLPTLFASFAGTFDGNNNTISYANVSGAALIVTTLTAAATIKDLTVNGCTVTNSGQDTGALVGRGNWGADLTITNCSVNATVKGNYATGLVIGGFRGTVNADNVNVSGTVKAASANQGFGGFVGMLYSWATVNLDKVALTNVTVIDDATAVTYAGGFVGCTNADNNTVSITDCSMTNVSVSGNDWVGGAVGYVNSTTVFTVNGLAMNNVNVVTVKNGDNGVGGLVGFMASGKNGTIEGVTATGLKVQANIGKGGNGGLIGWYKPAATDTLTIKNINIAGLDMDTTFQKWAIADSTSVANATRGTMGVGGIIGLYEANGASGLNITDVKIDGNIDTARPTSTCEGSTAGLIGFVTETSAMAYTDFDNYAGNITINRVEMLVDVVSNILYNGGTAALIGNYGQLTQGDWDSVRKDLYAANAVLDIEDVYIGGNVTGSAYAGGVIGYASFSGSTVNVNNVVFAGIISNPQYASQAALIITRGNRLGMNVTVKNCSATNAAIPLTHDMGNMGGKVAYNSYTAPTIIINGIEYTLNDNTRKDSLQRDAIITVTADEAAKMVQYTEAGFIKEVDGHLAGDYEQHTAVYDGKFDIRFITVAHIDNTTGYTVSIKAKTADGTFAFDNLVCEAYDSLIAYDNGLAAYSHAAADFGGRKFIAVVLQEIPAGAAYEFEVTVSYTTASGVVMSDVNTLYVTADGAFSSTPVVA